VVISINFEVGRNCYYDTLVANHDAATVYLIAFSTYKMSSTTYQTYQAYQVYQASASPGKELHESRRESNSSKTMAASSADKSLHQRKRERQQN
jgi:hypothetical protein